MANGICLIPPSTEPIAAEWERFDPSFAGVNGDDRLERWDESSGAVGVFRQPSNYANGHTRDQAGRLVTCEQATRRVTRTEHDGDESGRLWAATGDGVHCFHPDGDLLGKLRVPQTASNLCWGGPRLNHLFITATSTVYTIRLNVNGLR